MVHRRCRYCDSEKICITCNQIIQCKKITECKMCGGLYGRPKQGPISAGILIIDTTCESNIKTLLLFDKDGLTDPGGKVDPDKDRTPFDTVFRELYEETGLLLNVSLKDLKYVDLKNCYRLYLAYHSIDHPAFIRSKKSAELPLFFIPVKQLNKIRLSSRLFLLLNQKINGEFI